MIFPKPYCRAKVAGLLPVVVLILVGYGFEAGAQDAPAAMDGKSDDWVMVWEEPRHRLVFEKDNIRIISVNIPVGDTSGFHLHDRPTVYVAISGSVMKNQNLGAEWNEVNPDNVRTPGEIIHREDYLAKPLNHRVENVGERPFRLVGIMNFGNGMDLAATSAIGGVTPEVQSNWFRAYRHRLAPGTATEEYVHEHPVIIVQTIMGNSDVTENGYSVDEKTVSGLFSYHKAGVPLRLHNLGDQEVELVVVEIR